MAQSPQQQQQQFHGWLGLDAHAIGNMQWRAFTPKPWEETDVDIEISHCGICGSDLHTLSSGWVSIQYIVPCIFETGRGGLRALRWLR
jgi:alcohol dehydrogenase (NADP+)